MKSRFKRCRPYLGTFVEIELADHHRGEDYLEAAVNVAFERVATVHGLMSFHSSSSEVSLLNRQGHLSPVKVHAWTREVMEQSLRYSELSHGVFDVTVGARMVQWGFLPQMQSPVSVSGAPPSWRDIVIEDDGGIRFLRPLQIDLGGIAKGFAVDQAASALEEAGISCGVVNAGGDLRFVGEMPGNISVRHPGRPHARTLDLPVLGRAAATSGGYFSSRWRWWRRITHILHPQSGRSVLPAQSATVFAPTCLQADVLAKVALLHKECLAQSWFADEQAAVTFIDRAGEMTSFTPQSSLVASDSPRFFS